MKMRTFPVLVVLLVLVSACGTQRKARTVREGRMTASLQLPRQANYLPEYRGVTAPVRDTLRVTDLDGREMILMKAVRDEQSGEMVAAEMLDAAMVTARFRNIAERHGRVDLEFQVVVPPDMLDARWQLRLHPDMFVLQDSIRLDDVVVTGADYRRAHADLCLRPCAGSEGQRQAADDRGQRRHQDRAKPELRRREYGGDGFHARVHAELRELGDQDRVFRREADDHQDADLHIDTAHSPDRKLREERAEDARRDAQ